MKQREKEARAYIAPQIQVWELHTKLNLLNTLSTDLYIEGDIDGYEDIGEY